MPSFNRHIDFDGPETRKILRAGQQEALPTVLSHTRHLHALSFEVMKHLPAYYMIDRARILGRLAPGGPVVDTSSGTFALSLARVCRGRHPLTVVADHAVATDLRVALESLGASVEIVEAPPDAANLQLLRKKRRDEIAEATNAFVPNQYDNPTNPASYQAAAEILINRLGRIDVLVATVGSGGSSGGLANTIRQVNPNLRVVAIDTFGSVLFGLPVGPRRLRGLGNSLIPANVRHCVYDEVQWLAEDVALEGVMRLNEVGFGDHGLTSGAAWMAAEHIATQSPDAVVVAVLPDLGWRYREIVSDYSMRRETVSAVLPRTPLSVDRLSDATAPWCCFQWNRRTLDEVQVEMIQNQACR